MSYLIPITSGLTSLVAGNFIKAVGCSSFNLGKKISKAANHAPTLAAAGITLSGGLASEMFGATALTASIPLIITGGISLGYGMHKFAKSVCNFSNKQAIITGIAVGALGIMFACAN